MKVIVIGLLTMASVSAFAQDQKSECRKRVIESITQIQEVAEADNAYSDRVIQLIKAREYDLALNTQNTLDRLQNKIESIAKQVCR